MRMKEGEGGERKGERDFIVVEVVIVVAVA